VKAKIQRSRDVLKWLSERYDIEKDARIVAFESSRLPKTRTVDDIQMVEGRVARYYWQAIQSIIPEKYCFKTRVIQTHQYNASDPVNLCLNYAYGFLKCECRKVVNAVGLEPVFGFLHEPANYQTRISLVYDLQEPFRWLCDVTVIEAFESGLMDLGDFYFTGDNYVYSFNVEARRRFRQLVVKRFNAPVQYKGKTWKWNTIILNKTQELSRFLLGKSESVDFVNPSPILKRSDACELRKRISELTQRQALELGVSKSTLHYLKKHARDRKPFKICKKIATRLGFVS